jgi:hypothetical protein
MYPNTYQLVADGVAEGTKLSSFPTDFAAQ